MTTLPTHLLLTLEAVCSWLRFAANNDVREGKKFEVQMGGVGWGNRILTLLFQGRVHVCAASSASHAASKITTHETGWQSGYCVSLEN